jgi:hypothetical protein
MLVVVLVGMLAFVKAVFTAMPGFVNAAIPVLKGLLELLTVVKDILTVIKDIVTIVREMRGQQQPQWGDRVSIFPSSIALTIHILTVYRFLKALLLAKSSGVSFFFSAPVK